jgi:hypothetical protein
MKTTTKLNRWVAFTTSKPDSEDRSEQKRKTIMTQAQANASETINYANDVQIAVMAHFDPVAQATFNRHLPLWQRHGAPILVFCPQNSIAQTQLPLVIYGRASHHDAEANARFKYLLNWLNTEPALQSRRWFVIFEYDALCLSPTLPIAEIAAGLRPGEAVVAGPVFQEAGPVPNFKGTRYIHPPLIFNRPGLAAVCAVLKSLPDDAEAGFWDRLLGYATEVGKIPFHNLHKTGRGFSANTIEPSQIDAACSAVEKGAVWIHGVKTELCLQKLMQTYQNLIAPLSASPGTSTKQNV